MAPEREKEKKPVTTKSEVEEPKSEPVVEEELVDIATLSPGESFKLGGETFVINSRDVKKSRAHVKTSTGDAAIISFGNRVIKV